MKNNILKLVLLLNILGVIHVNAQKLPNEQNTSIYLPPSVKIDGLAMEWNNVFQCYNKNTNIFSTIANNKQSLYLVLNAIDPLIIKKIISGGITFTICTTGQRNDENPYSITFPTIAEENQASIFNTINEISSNTNQLDSLINNANQKLNLATKSIKTKGFKMINDAEISIYNKLGIKAAILVNKKGELVCELMIPFRLLGMTENKEVSIAYNIMLNGATAIKTNKLPPGGRVVSVSSVPMSLAQNGNDTKTIQFPTDYWGNYKIARSLLK